MNFSDKNLNLDDLIANESKFLKKRTNGLLLSDEDIRILEEYEIEYLKFNNLGELIFEITKVLNENPGDAFLLEELNIKLGEYNYYNYTNK